MTSTHDPTVMTSHGILLMSLKLKLQIPMRGGLSSDYMLGMWTCCCRHRQVFLSDISRTPSEWSSDSLVPDKSSGMVSLRGHREYARFRPEIDRPEKWDLDACSDSLKVYLQSWPKERLLVSWSELTIQSWAIRWAIGCVNSGPATRGRQEADSRNLGPICVICEWSTSIFSSCKFAVKSWSYP